MDKTPNSYTSSLAKGMCEDGRVHNPKEWVKRRRRGKLCHTKTRKEEDKGGCV